MPNQLGRYPSTPVRGFSELGRAVEHSPYTIAKPAFEKKTHKSTQPLAEELGRQGWEIFHFTVARCLREMGYSLQANLKSVEGIQHSDRDAQFRC